MIKPEDIPDAFVAKCEEIHPAFEDNRFDAEDVADILNAAIEAGLVAPASEAKVLRRALEVLRKEAEWYYGLHGDMPSNAGSYIEQARKELESEEQSDQAR